MTGPFERDGYLNVTVQEGDVADDWSEWSPSGPDLAVTPKPDFDGFGFFFYKAEWNSPCIEEIAAGGVHVGATPCQMGVAAEREKR